MAKFISQHTREGSPDRAGTKTELLSPDGRHGHRVPPSQRQATPGKGVDAGGRFRIESELARGGMAVIYRAWDTRMSRAVAVKVLFRHLVGDPAMERRFLEEANLLARLEHPGIVPVFEIGRSRRREPFFAMGLVEGETLALSLSRQAGNGEFPKLLGQFERVCNAVGHAHSRGMVHRDLKPENVMTGPFGVVKVIDWGIARQLDAVIDEADPDGGLVLGTPAYLPPEQAAGDIDRVDERGDVFSLGGILCEMITGFPPYVGGDASEVLGRACRADLEDAHARLDASDVDHELIALAERCLQPRPGDRPRDAGEVATVLHSYLASDVRRIERDQARFFELSLELFCIAGLNGYFRRINSNFPRLLGYPEKELVSRPFIDYVHPDDREATYGAMKDLGEGRLVVRFVNRYRHADGHYLSLEWSAQAIPEEGVIYAVARPVP